MFLKKEQLMKPSTIKNAKLPIEEHLGFYN